MLFASVDANAGAWCYQYQRCKLLTIRVYTMLLRREMAFINAFLKL